MQKIGKYISALLFVCIFADELSLFGQPTGISVNGADLYQTGYNSSNTLDSKENTDSVTVGSTIPYYMMPDSIINAGFRTHLLDDAANNNLITSTFDWQVTGGTAANVGGIYKGNFVQINWTATGSQTIESYEYSSTACTGNTVITNVAVIPAPTVTGVTISNINCITTPVNVALDTAIISISSSMSGINKGFEASYTLTGPGAYSQAGTDVAVSDAGVLDLSGLPNLTNAGAYTLTITAISDRISTKCGVTPAVIAVSKIFYVMIIPGKLGTKHLKNDSW